MEKLPEAIEYVYDKRREMYSITKSGIVPAVVCGKCGNTRFQITYGECECFAVCPCGHRMSIYSG